MVLSWTPTMLSWYFHGVSWDFHGASMVFSWCFMGLSWRCKRFHGGVNVCRGLSWSFQSVFKGRSWGFHVAFVNFHPYFKVFPWCFHCAIVGAHVVFTVLSCCFHEPILVFLRGTVMVFSQTPTVLSRCIRFNCAFMGLSCIVSMGFFCFFMVMCELFRWGLMVLSWCFRGGVRAIVGLSLCFHGAFVEVYALL